jgi:hypothetical protein
MPKTKFQEVIFTIIMATFMVYGMIVYNIALATKEVTGEIFFNAFHELPVMTWIAFVLELFVVGKIARMLAGKISLAVRRDVFTKTFDEKAFEDFIEKVEEIEKNNPFPTKTTKKRKEEKGKSKNKKRKSKKRNKRR